MEITKLLNTIIHGDTLTILKTMPDEIVNCVITSPPYWGLRDYGVYGQLGLEKTYEEYITKLCDIFDEIKRVLKKDGTCWVNIGDTYAGNNVGSYNIPTKSLCLIPQRFAIEMVNRGWILRNVIIWHKPNCMPSSAKDRFTVDFEYVYFFVKNKKYWFEQQFEKHKSSPHGGKFGHNGNKDNNFGNSDKERFYKEQGRNKRSVWAISTQPFSGAHFATYPEKLITPMIEAGCPKYVCNKCGKPIEKIIDNDKMENTKQVGNCVGYCKCDRSTDFDGGVVLDPFIGSGTTALVAKKLGRNYIGIELNPKYIEIANNRLTHE